ncbi:MAG: MBL fold metallo-hydrolase, partial [Clostridiales bacterium]|nr:MBL fold metallo-hydrolase [Clostridiales bacterium]
MKRRMWLLPLLLTIAFLCSCVPDNTQADLPPLSESYELAAQEAPVETTPPDDHALPAELEAASEEDTASISSSAEENPEDARQEAPDTPAQPPQDSTEPANTVSGLQVTIFDVGQADCVLVQAGAHNMLIDAGNIGQDELILGYLSRFGVSKLDYAVATHPHADHIGSMAAVLLAMESVGTMLMPDITHTTKTFEAMLDAIEKKDIPVAIAYPGETFALGKAMVQILAPNKAHYSGLNDHSVVLRAEFGEIAFLFAGDAETNSENDQLINGLPLNADVLKAGHHGSRTSSGQKYLEAVAPKYVVISCGKGNTYGHPHAETTGRLAGMDAEIYRIDENGTMIFVTDGKNIT